jgi:hypothetical protein
MDSFVAVSSGYQTSARQAITTEVYSDKSDTLGVETGGEYLDSTVVINEM